MELKDYQIKVIEGLEDFIHELKQQKSEKLDYYDFQQSKGKDAVHPEISDYCQLTWAALKARKEVHTPDYKVRNDGMGRNIPNICFKVPTGGGKTLLAAVAVQRINQDCFDRNNGFVLWIVPSDTIYKQTSKHLRNKEHPYRQMLDRASGGRTVILEKNDAFSLQDTQDNLCVMLLMLQSSNRQNKNTLRMFKDSGRFESFFPDIDDYNANNELLNQVSNLETTDVYDNSPDVIQGISIKHSLGNAMRLLRPVVVVDEGHKATTKLAQDTLNSFNPRFILELSATPKPNSNVLYSVGGAELKKEQMIKLPINVRSFDEPNWKATLNNAHDKLLELHKESSTLQEKDGKYIRPIMVIKAESKKKDNNYDHVEDIKKYLMENLEVTEDEIRIKLSEKDEIGDEDLLHNLCPVKYIITKDALKEGWDCSFAYILALLSNTKAKTALTQFIGRVLRQPYAEETSIEALNQCYVYYNNSDAGDSVDGIKKGLEDEGMGDVSDQISTGGDSAEEAEVVITKRAELYRESKIFLPRLNVIESKGVRNFDYYRDILSCIKWMEYSFNKVDEVILCDRNIRDYQQSIVDIEDGKMGELNLSYPTSKASQEVSSEIDISLMASQLMEKIPNPWQATRIIEETIGILREKGQYDDVKIALNSVFIVEEIKKDCLKWIIKESENIFRNKLDTGVLFLKLVAEPFLEMNWEMAQEMPVLVGSNEAPLQLDKVMFQPQYRSSFNNYEYRVASYINKSEAVKWWHRLAVKGSEYSVQGWKRERIYPDFLVKLEKDKNGISKLHFIETKGQHLEGNKDTEYKQKVFDYFNTYVNKDIEPVGELQFISSKEELSFDMIFEDEWQNEIRKIL